MVTVGLAQKGRHLKNEQVFLISQNDLYTAHPVSLLDPAARNLGNS